MDGVEEQLDNKRMFLVKSCPTAVAVPSSSILVLLVGCTLLYPRVKDTREYIVLIFVL